MHIGYVNFAPLSYTVETPFISPLGGSESGLCYLSLSLANFVDQIVLFSRINKPKLINGVLHLPVDKMSFETFKDLNLDFLVIQNTAKYALGVKKILTSKTKLIFWNEHTFNQPDVIVLKDKNYQNLFDAFVFVSSWQMNDYLSYFNLNKDKCVVLKNAISPFFHNIFNRDVFEKRKNKPPILAYTSTPFRGLNILLEVFPEIRKRFPDALLWVFSSMKVYQDEDAPFKNLYNKAQAMKGVFYFGSISQVKLAKRLVEASILAYPNIFPETSCIAAMEAMAAGLSVVTSNLGALPETTAGYADLVDIGSDKEKYKDEFVKNVVKNLEENFSEEKYLRLKKQSEFVNEVYDWNLRAKEWKKFLNSI